MRTLPILAIGLILLAGCSLGTKVPPVANAGPDVSLRVGQRVVLDGSKSYDPDGGQVVNYNWQIMGTPEGREDRLREWLVQGNQEPVWTTPWLATEEELGQWIIRLQAIDDEGLEATDDLVVTIIP